MNLGLEFDMQNIGEMNDILLAKLAEILGTEFAEDIGPLLAQPFIFNWKGETKNFSIVFIKDQDLHIKSMKFKRASGFLRLINPLIGIGEWLADDRKITLPTAVYGNVNFANASINFNQGTSIHTALGKFGLRNVSFARENMIDLGLNCISERTISIDRTISIFEEFRIAIVEKNCDRTMCLTASEIIKNTEALRINPPDFDSLTKDDVSKEGASLNSGVGLPKGTNKKVTFTFANPTDPKISQVTLGLNPVDSTTAQKATAIVTDIFKVLVAILLKQYQDEYARLMASKQFTVSFELPENENKLFLNIFYNEGKNNIDFHLSERTSKQLKESLTTTGINSTKASATSSTLYLPTSTQLNLLLNTSVKRNKFHTGRPREICK